MVQQRSGYNAGPVITKPLVPLLPAALSGATLDKSFTHMRGGTGVRGLTRGLATLPPMWIQEHSMVTDRDGRPPRGHSGSALLLCV